MVGTSISACRINASAFCQCLVIGFLYLPHFFLIWCRWSIQHMPGGICFSPRETLHYCCSWRLFPLALWPRLGSPTSSGGPFSGYLVGESTSLKLGNSGSSPSWWEWSHQKSLSSPPDLMTGSEEGESSSSGLTSDSTKSGTVSQESSKLDFLSF